MCRPLHFVGVSLVATLMAVVTTIAFAWIPAASVWDGQDGGLSEGEIAITRFESRWGTRYEREMWPPPGEQPSEFLSQPWLLLGEARALEYDEAKYLRQQELRRDGYWGAHFPLRNWSATERGWPFRCLWSWRGTDGTRSETGGELVGWKTVRLVWLTPSDSFRISEQRAIPFLPLWRGFIANSAAFTACWMVLLLAGSRVRSVFRRRRGLCAGCDYDQRGTPADQPCPECGRARA